MSLYWTEVLFEALWNEDVDAFTEAVSKGGDLRALDERGQTIMNVAVASGADMVRLALNAGADPNQMDHEGNTPLRVATLSGDVYAIQMLLSANAFVDAETPSDGSTSLHIAAENCFDECLTFLLKCACQKKLNSFDYVGRTPLICAVQKRCLLCAELLIAAGADVNARDEGRLGDSALAFAVENEDLPMISLLMRAGGNPNAQGFMQDTPLMKAERLTSPERGQIVCILKGQEANP